MFIDLSYEWLMEQFDPRSHHCRMHSRHYMSSKLVEDFGFGRSFPFPSPSIDIHHHYPLVRQRMNIFHCNSIHLRQWESETNEQTAVI